jgi:predicted porin
LCDSHNVCVAEPNHPARLDGYLKRRVEQDSIAGRIVEHEYMGGVMKKIVLGALAGACFPTLALAQTSVQLYGIADAGLMWQRGSSPKIISGGEDGSRLGIKGSEDLGRGMKAVFNLEARVELDTGRQQPTLINENQGYYLTRGMEALPPNLLAAVRSALQPRGGPAVNPENALFDRTSMVGLVTPVGALLVGRMYTPGYEVFAAADTFEVGTGGTWGSVTGGTAGFQALGADIRSQRALQYRAALPSGLGGSVMIAGRGSGYYGLYNKFWGAAITYKARGWDVGVGHNHGYDPSGAPSLRTTTAGGSYTWNEVLRRLARSAQPPLDPAAHLHRRLGRADRTPARTAGPGHCRRPARGIRQQHQHQQPAGCGRLPDRRAVPHRPQPHPGLGRAPERPYPVR